MHIPSHLMSPGHASHVVKWFATHEGEKSRRVPLHSGRRRSRRHTHRGAREVPSLRKVFSCSVGPRASPRPSGEIRRHRILSQVLTEVIVKRREARFACSPGRTRVPANVALSNDTLCLIAIADTIRFALSAPASEEGEREPKVQRICHRLEPTPAGVAG